MVPLSWYLVLAAGLFCIGLYGTLARRNAINVLMGIELMFNAVNINLLAFWRHTTPQDMVGQAFAVFVIALAAGEAAVGLALVLAIYRSQETVDVPEINMMKW